MDATMHIFLVILRAALRGEKLVLDREVAPDEWHRLFRLAGIHKVLPLFYEVSYREPSLMREEALLASAKHQIRKQVFLQTVRTADFLEVNDRLQAAGVQPLVVKGIICRNLYPHPDHRPSGDEDVLIPPEQFETCHRVLTEFGMQAGEFREKLSSAYEVPYRKAGSPLYIELHKHLFPPESDAYGSLNRFFAAVRERAVAVEIQGKTVYTLGCTDHLFYLICHAFKHFLHSGFGIRQVCDMMLFANEYGAGIDWTQIVENCKAIRAEKFAAAMFRIGEKYLVFDQDRAACSGVWQKIEVDEAPMLEDLLSGGLYGDANLSRKHSSNITLDVVAAQRQRRKAKNPVVASAFPSASALESRYPYLKKHPYLLPVAWSSRLWEYAREAGHVRDSNASDALKIGNERVALMKAYGIID